MAICLNVDKAMIFFISCSQLADSPAYKAVIDEITMRISIVEGWVLVIIRIIRKIPAVTKVDECTRAEMGVGADIAIGNQAENGNCALFVHLANINIIIVKRVIDSFIFSSHIDENIIILIDKRIKISPIRFLKRVIDPEPEDELFW